MIATDRGVGRRREPLTQKCPVLAKRLTFRIFIQLLNTLPLYKPLIMWYTICKKKQREVRRLRLLLMSETKEYRKPSNGTLDKAFSRPINQDEGPYGGPRYRSNWFITT